MHIFHNWTIKFIFERKSNWNSRFTRAHKHFRLFAVSLSKQYKLLAIKESDDKRFQFGFRDDRANNPPKNRHPTTTTTLVLRFRKWNKWIIHLMTSNEMMKAGGVAINRNHFWLVCALCQINRIFVYLFYFRFATISFWFLRCCFWNTFCSCFVTLANRENWSKIRKNRND